MKPKRVIISITLLCITSAGALYAFQRPQGAQPTALQPSPASGAAPRPALAHTVGVAAATPPLIAVGTTSQVRFTIQITDPALVTNGVNLLSLGATGTQPTILGAMQDNGNGLYILQRSFNDPAAGQIQFQVSAAFKGALQRVLSNVVTVSVGTAVTDVSSGLTFTLPPLGVTPLVTNLGPITGADFVIITVAVDPSDNLTHPLFRIVALPNPSQQSLQTWFESNIDDTSGTLLASGAFQDQELSNGLALVLVGAIPATYQGGPVAEAYMVLPGSQNRVYAIAQSQDGALTDFGYSASSVPTIITSILGSMH